MCNVGVYKKHRDVGAENGTLLLGEVLYRLYLQEGLVRRRTEWDERALLHQDTAFVLISRVITIDSTFRDIFYGEVPQNIPLSRYVTFFKQGSDTRRRSLYSRTSTVSDAEMYPRCSLSFHMT